MVLNIGIRLQVQLYMLLDLINLLFLNGNDKLSMPIYFVICNGSVF
jgi:hypothetical protein